MHKSTRFIWLTVLLSVSLASCTAAKLPPIRTPIPLTSTTIPPTVTETPESIIATPLPTQPPIVFAITPDVIQVTHWKEYQTELARCVLAQAKCDYSQAENSFCEWDILGSSGQEVYVWAVCKFLISGKKPAVIHLNSDGSIQKVEVPRYGPEAASDVQRLFPIDIQAKISLYDQLGHSGKELELERHLLWRQDHLDLDQPPLIILSTTPVP